MSFLSWPFGKKPQAPAPEPRTAPSPALTTPRATTAPHRPAAPAPAPTGFTLPAGPFRFIALDVETANSDASSICQIGLACVRHDGTMHVASTLIDPEQPFSDFNVDLHGIGPAQVIGAPKFPAVLHQIAPLLGQQPVIQHSTFDRGAINGACRAYGLPEPGWQWADSVQIARRAWPEFRGNGGHGLGHLKQALALDFEHHDAGEDAKAAALVVLRAEIHTAKTLEEILSPSRKVSAVEKRAKGPTSKAGVTPANSDLEAIMPLIAFLSETPPLSRQEIDRLRKSTSMRAVAQTDRKVQGLRSIPDSDRNFAIQAAIVDTCCRAYFSTGDMPAPAYAWRIAVLLAKAKQVEIERQFLAAWCRHFSHGNGVRYGHLVERARKYGIFE